MWLRVRQNVFFVMPIPKCYNKPVIHSMRRVGVCASRYDSCVAYKFRVSFCTASVKTESTVSHDAGSSVIGRASKVPEAAYFPLATARLLACGRPTLCTKQTRWHSGNRLKTCSKRLRPSYTSVSVSCASTNHKMETGGAWCVRRNSEEGGIS